MTVRVAIYFLGRNRPAYFEGDHLHDVLEVVIEAAENCDRDSRNKLYGWIIAAEESVAPDRPRVSIEHGAFGLVIDLDAQPLGAILEIAAHLPPFPGLDYSKALKVKEDA
jgi:hypothetical protein